MLYFFYGADIDKARAAIERTVEGLLKKKAGAEVFSYTDETFDPGVLPELIHGQGLFEHKHVVVLKRVLENDEAKAAVYGARKDIAASENIFLLFESTLDAKTKTAFEKVAEKTVTLDPKDSKIVGKGAFNRFILADALVEGDKQKLWVAYQKAKESEASEEELHGMLLWQARAILLARRFASPEAAGLKPFVYQKSKRARYSDEESERIARGLLTLYHDARRGHFDLGEGLERFILGM